MVLSEGTTEKKSPVTPPGIDPGTVRLIAQHLNHYATPENRAIMRDNAEKYGRAGQVTDDNIARAHYMLDT